MEIRASYSFDLDVWNYLHSVYKFAWYKHGKSNLQEKLLSSLPNDLVANLQNAKDTEKARIIIESFLLKNIENRKKKYSVVGRDLESVWKKEGPKIESRLEKL